MDQIIFNAIQTRQIMDMGPVYWKLKDQILNAAKKGSIECVFKEQLCDKLIETLQQEGFFVTSLKEGFLVKWAW